MERKGKKKKKKKKIKKKRRGGERKEGKGRKGGGGGGGGGDTVIRGKEKLRVEVKGMLTNLCGLYRDATSCFVKDVVPPMKAELIPAIMSYLEKKQSIKN